MHNDEVMRGMMFILLFAMSVAHGETMDLVRLKAQFIETMKPVDRVTMTPLIFERSADDSGPSMLNREAKFDLTDTVAIQDLARRFEPSDWSGMPCMCIGESMVEFYRGSEFVASFTVHHGSRFRASFSPWWGDVILDEAGAKHFLSWFAEHGYEGFIDSQETFEESIEQERDAVQDVLPEASFNLSPWAVPEFEYADAYDAKKQREFRTSFADDQSFLRASWSLLAATGVYRYDDLPIRFVFESIKQISEDSLVEALRALRGESDLSVKLGGSLFVFSPRGATEEIRGRLPGSLIVDFATVLESGGTQLDQSLLDYGLSGFSQIEVMQFLLIRVEEFGPTPLPKNKQNKSISLRFDCEVEEISDNFRSESKSMRAALGLARNEYREAIPRLRSLLENAPEGGDRLALEVAISHLDLDGESLVGVEHLANGWSELETMAFRVFQTRGTETLPVRDLVRICEISRSGGMKRESLAREWAEAELAKLGVIATVDLPNDKPSQCEVEALERLHEGDYDEAWKRFEEIVELHEPLNAIKALLACGRFGEAGDWIYRHLGSRHDKPKDPEGALMIRGYFSFTTGRFSEASKDFAGAKRLTEKEWPRVMEHLALLSADLETRSDLGDWRPFTFGDEEPYIGSDEAAIMYLQGKIDETRLLAESDERSLSRAHWLISQVARQADDGVKERVHLAEVLALGDYADEVHILAHLRERELRWADEMNR